MATDGRSARWDAHNAARRARILDAAIEVLESEPSGAEVHVRQIAEQAGVARTVVYRFFEDKADLDHAIRRRVVRRLREALLPALTLEGSALQIIGGIISAYVEWADEHPALHAVVEREADQGADQDQVAVALTALLQGGADLVGATLSKDEQAALPLMVSGLIGQVYGAVRLWVARPTREPSAEVLADLLSRSIWYLVDGHLQAHGLDIAPDRPLGERPSG
ncbi:MAG TPA: TetR/AcrR family transcriptional regulator [Nocardioidaceae bacterium]|nr:TetR/AcrR family transcriptional regulator [Nocardioidaceae bacterium]